MAPQHGHHNGQHAAHDSALSVGATDDALRIQELEKEVSFLAEKTASASERYANYENEIQVLQAKMRREQRRNAAMTAAGNADSANDGRPTTAQPMMQGISRFGSFMHSRKPVTAPAVQEPGVREKELEASLVKEQTLRIAAEKKATQVTAEIEELSATLFMQANEMVACERRENAELRDKLAILEAKGTVSDDPSELQRQNIRLRDKLKAMEQREVDRKRRLEKLEAASRRIERAHALLRPR